MSSAAIIRMDGQKTAIINNKIDSTQQSEDGMSGEYMKEFTFDYSYWSFDSYDPGFASQELVYKDLGADVVTDAFEGYNCCIFAYGQTGSGKTYTMMGTPDSEGLIPRICQQLFAQMKTGRNSGATYRTEVSYLEIYNETVKDLLNKNCQKQSLRVREHPKLGPYVQDLSKHLVQDYSDLQILMNRGNTNRTTAATKMNDTSSRSHAIFTISFSMASFTCNTPRETLSKINLVDLAGSERATTTKAEGQRLIEGGHINKSLVTLGSVISALADKSSSKQKKKQFFIPYRDSVLTWLLKDSLGGNSKTIMIAALSPAECNYGETLSTLRYANRAKNIINKPTINEDTNTKLIRELRSEIERLHSMLTECPNAIEKLHENEARVKLLTEEWTEKWKETHKILTEQRTLGLRRSGFGIILDSELPHLVGIDDDLLSTGITLYHLKEGKTTIGTAFGDTKQDIVLQNAIDVEDEHCYIELNDGVATLVPINSAVCFVNNIQIDKPVRLSQGCVIVLGQNIMFRFNDPKEVERLRNDKEKGSALNLSKIFSRSSDFSKSFESLDTSGHEFDLMGNKINEKRRQIEDLEKEYGLAEEQRKADLITADEELMEKRLELERLKTESDKLRKIIDESKLIIQNNDSILNLCVNSGDESMTISDMLLSMKDKTEDAKQRISDVLSTITSNALNRKEELTHKSVLQNIYETLTQQIEDMANEDIESNSNDNQNLCNIRNNFYDKKDNNISDLPNISKDAQTLEPNKCRFKEMISNNNFSNGFEINNKLNDSNSRSVCDLNQIRNDFQKVLLLPDESNFGDSSDRQSVINLSCDLNRNFEANLIELRLTELQSTFEKQLSELQNQFELQRLSFEDQKRIENEKLENERKRLQELEDSHISAIVEREVQRRLQLKLEDSFRNQLYDDYCEAKHLTSSPIRVVSPPRSPYSNPSLTNIIENSFESSVGTKSPIGDHFELNSISICIPSYALRGSVAHEYHVYEIKVDVSGQKWTLLRRYRRFRELYASMNHKYGSKVECLDFPPRIWFDNRTDTVARKRRKALERYLRELIAICETIRTCPLNYKAFGLESLTKECLEEFSPFFIKDCFEVDKQLMP